MSNMTIATLPRIKPAALRSLLIDPASAKTLAVIDVRGSDYIGGHIKSCHNIPTNTLDTALPEAVRTLADKELVVFTCMLSQQRGPYTALKYARERERLLKESEGGGKVLLDLDAESGSGKGQKIVILEGGFDAWVQAGFGQDEKVTEGFVKDLWEGYSD